MRPFMKKFLLVLMLSLSLTLLSACSNPLEDALTTLSERDVYAFTYEIEMENYTIDSVYKRDGDKSYYSFDGDEMYQETTETKTVRITRNQAARWQRETLAEHDHLIPEDTVILNPILLETSMFEKEDEEGTYHLKESEYETVFGDKAETIQSFTFDPESDPLTFTYTFTHEGTLVPVKVEVTYDDVSVSLPI